MELERALIAKVNRFLVEMGGMFAFMGNQFRLEIAGEEFHRMRKVERVGSEIGRMMEFMKQAGLKEPVFESDTGRNKRDSCRL